MKFRLFFMALLAATFIAGPALADQGTQPVDDLVKALSGVNFEGTWFLQFQNGKTLSDSAFNKFQVNRAYLTFKKKLPANIDSRLTIDTYQASDGSMNMRLKYVYALFKPASVAFFTKPAVEFGQVHTPWLDFEEHINWYRMQGTMFMERNGLFSAADYGVTVMANLGGDVSDDYQKSVSKSYPGRYGSIALGVYNGGGYSAAETNTNKTIQGRISIRPVPDVVPGLQVSYLGVAGGGNKANSHPPYWRTNAGMLSYEAAIFTVTGQYVTGAGNNKGTYSPGVVYTGFSAFAEVKPDDHWRVIARMDKFDPNKDVSDDANSRLIAGVGYDFGKRNILLLDYDQMSPEKLPTGAKNPWTLDLTMQVNF